MMPYILGITLACFSFLCLAAGFYFVCLIDQYLRDDDDGFDNSGDTIPYHDDTPPSDEVIEEAWMEQARRRYN